jgi:hypothetical protein
MPHFSPAIPARNAKKEGCIALGIPLPATTQSELMEVSAKSFRPVRLSHLTIGTKYVPASELFGRAVQPFTTVFE